VAGTQKDTSLIGFATKPQRAAPPREVEFAPAGAAKCVICDHTIEVDNFYVKQHWGLADFRVQSYEATEKWCAMVFLALVFLQWRFNHAHTKEQWHALADVVRQHRYEHARTLLETACQEAAKVRDYLPVLQRFLCQPT
jgi:hypothetical protein